MTYSPTLVYLEEKDTSFECCVGLIVDPSSIAHLLQHPGLTDHYLVQEDLTIEGSDSEELHVGDHVHLVFITSHPVPGEIAFTFPCQNLLTATVSEASARSALIEHRKSLGSDLIHLWTLPVGWMSPELDEFLKSHTPPGI